MPYIDLGPGPQKNTWGASRILAGARRLRLTSSVRSGAALISKFPILRSSHHLLPSPNGELAPAIYATLDVYGTEVDVVVAHNGQEEDPLDRELQSKELGRLMRESWPKPTVFLGGSPRMARKRTRDSRLPVYRLPRHDPACRAAGAVQARRRRRPDARHQRELVVVSAGHGKLTLLSHSRTTSTGGVSTSSTEASSAFLRFPSPLGRRAPDPLSPFTVASATPASRAAATRA